MFFKKIFIIVACIITSGLCLIAGGGLSIIRYIGEQGKQWSNLPLPIENNLLFIFETGIFTIISIVILLIIKFFGDMIDNNKTVILLFIIAMILMIAGNILYDTYIISPLIKP